jgi:hypothetical protein
MLYMFYILMKEIKETCFSITDYISISSGNYSKNYFLFHVFEKKKSHPSRSFSREPSEI